MTSPVDRYAYVDTRYTNANLATLAHCDFFFTLPTIPYKPYSSAYIFDAPHLLTHVAWPWRAAFPVRPSTSREPILGVKSDLDHISDMILHILLTFISRTTKVVDASARKKCDKL